MEDISSIGQIPCSTERHVSCFNNDLPSQSLD